ncbi:MAG: radical SAM family heme chaperone HemW [Alphaproteobacteria bacterium]
METLSIYIHWPFCQKKCPYCDFNSYAEQSIDAQQWQKAYGVSLLESLEHTGKREVVSIYFGGGTPSLMPPFILEDILEKIEQIHHLSSNIEITLEANPTSFEQSRFKAFKAAGINRLSIGVQSLRDDALKFLGRWHNVADAMQTLEFAHKYFNRYSFDLIYARPEQSLNDWAKELNEAIDLAKGHLSLYQLTIEPATEFGRKKVQPAKDDMAAEMYLYTLETMEKAMMAAYEVSNFASAGQQSRHNLAYWKMNDWVGIGPGAHGRFTQDGQRIATQDSLYPDGWLKKVMANNHGRQSMSIIPFEEQITEQIMTGLRMAEGISFELIHHLDSERIETLITQGLLKRLPNGNIAATYQGWLVLNSLLAWLL